MVRALLPFAVALLTACGTPAPAEVAPSVDVDKVATITRALRQDPARADAILAEHGMTRQALEDALYAIAADEALTVQYRSQAR